MVPIAKPSLVILNKVNKTLHFGLYSFVNEGGSRTELMMAASTIVVVPMIILFLFTRKQIVNGVARGGLKG